MTDDRISFFGIEVEAWKIGNSFPAPKFNVVSEPNEWTRDVTANVKENISEKDSLRLKFWRGYQSYLSSVESPIQPKKPSHRPHNNYPLGKKGYFLTAVASFYDSISSSYDRHELRVDVVFRSSTGFPAYSKMLQAKQEIETEFGKPLIWIDPSDTSDTRYRIRTQKHVNLYDETSWIDCYRWFEENILKMDKVFRPRIQEI